jgi:hypothetical protein
VWLALTQHRFNSQAASGLQQSPGSEHEPVSFGKQQVPAGQVAFASQQSVGAEQPGSPAGMQPFPA